MKSKILGILGAVGIMALCVLMNVLSSNKVISENEKRALEDNESEVSKKEDVKDTNEDKKADDKKPVEAKKVAVVYFSATGTTKKIAEYINEKVAGTLFEIVPSVPYTEADLNYSNNSSRSYIEDKDDSIRPELKNAINLDGYDIVYLGYPIWYDNVPKVVLSFIDTTNISGKTVIPFCTSSSSEITNSLNILKKYKTDVKWIDGKKIKDDKEEVLNWVSSLQY